MAYGLENSEAEHDRFHLEVDAEARIDGNANFVGKSDDVVSSCAAAVDESQGVARGKSSSTTNETFVEACLFDKPGRRKFYANGILRSWYGRKPRQFFLSSECDVVGLLRGDNGVLEETAGAAAVGIVVDKQHAFGLTNAAHGCGDFGKARLGTGRKGALQIRVAQNGCSARLEVVVDASDDESSAIG